MCSTKSKAYVTAMKSDLRNLADAQQRYFAANHHYASSASELRIRQSTGVQPITIRVTDAGWVAVVTHSRIGGYCVIYEGQRPDAAPPASSEARQPWCQGSEPRYDALLDARFDRGIANSLFLTMVMLTITAGIFLSRGKGWTTRFLLGLSVLYPLLAYPLCGGGASVTGAALTFAPAVALFLFALRRQVVTRSVLTG